MIPTYVLRVVLPDGTIARQPCPDRATAYALRDAARAEWPGATLTILQVR